MVQLSTAKVMVNGLLKLSPVACAQKLVFGFRMRSVLNFISMLALGLMIAAVIVVAPIGAPTAGVAGFEIEAPSFDYRSVIAGLGIGLLIALIAQVPWKDAARRCGVWLIGQAQRLWLIGWAAVFLAVLFYF